MYESPSWLHELWVARDTLSKLADGSLLGDNTDGAGLVRDLTVNAGFSLRGKRILLLGAGANDLVEKPIEEKLLMTKLLFQLRVSQHLPPRGAFSASVHATQGDFVEADTVLLRFAD